MTVRCRAPLRLGLAGGGTDLSPFCDEYGGAVLNCTIDRYAYAFLELNDTNQVIFRAQDLGVQEAHEANNQLDASTGLRLHRGIYNRFFRNGKIKQGQGLTLTTTVDAPAGSGLGSSSALVVAICEAFNVLFQTPAGLYDLAHMAFEIERQELALAGGKQDQYATTFGGVNFIEFLKDDRVIVNPLRIAEPILNELETSLIVCFSGISRESANIITQQTANMRGHDTKAMDALISMKESAYQMKDALLQGDMSAMGAILERGWQSKKQTSSAISNPHIEQIFETGLKAGAYAGKISGAGGGGFIFFLVPPDQRYSVISELRGSGAEAGPVHLTSKGVETWIVPTQL
jgi:D-glycero-alpha-D-manno-heptose-7-phosphate kinase